MRMGKNPVRKNAALGKLDGNAGSRDAFRHSGEHRRPGFPFGNKDSHCAALVEVPPVPGIGFL